MCLSLMKASVKTKGFFVWDPSVKKKIKSATLILILFKYTISVLHAGETKTYKCPPPPAKNNPIRANKVELWACDRSPRSPQPVCPSLSRSAICFNCPNEARPSLRSSETPPPHWPNQTPKASAPLASSGSGQATSQPRSVISSTPGA